MIEGRATDLGERGSGTLGGFVEGERDWGEACRDIDCTQAALQDVVYKAYRGDFLLEVGLGQVKIRKVRPALVEPVTLDPGGLDADLGVEARRDAVEIAKVSGG
ncbi:MAG: hypothetical protein AAGI72_07640 [Pseudomonadota bacterium]